MSRNLKVTIEYDGTDYCGWQIQDNGRTVQGEIQKAIEKLTEEKITVCGSSRTDAGVHAKGFVFNFITDTTIPCEKFPLALNAFLPTDICALSCAEVSDTFHARYDAKIKTYSYLFYPSSTPSALLQDRAWHIKTAMYDGKTFDFYKEKSDKMNEAAKYFIGTHDFTAFRAIGSTVTTTERTIYSARTEVISDNYISGKTLFRYTVSGNGFLYNMVRIMAGTLSEIMLGKREPESILDAIESKQRKKAGMTAPASGLYLESVTY